jgi:hypothetical protein
MALFSGEYQPPGFSELNIPPPHSETAAVTVNDGTATGQTIAFTERIAFAMNDAVAMLRT